MSWCFFKPISTFLPQAPLILCCQTTTTCSAKETPVCIPGIQGCRYWFLSSFWWPGLGSCCVYCTLQLFLLYSKCQGCRLSMFVSHSQKTNENPKTTWIFRVSSLATHAVHQLNCLVLRGLISEAVSSSKSSSAYSCDCSSRDHLDGLRSVWQPLWL